MSSKIIDLATVRTTKGRISLNRSNLVSLAALPRSARVEYLYARDNYLTDIDVQPLDSLKILDLGCNALTTTSLARLVSFPSLRQLYLNGNRLTALDTLPELPSLEHLALSHNYIRRLDGAPALPRLKLLSLAGNPLEDFAGLPFHAELEVICLDGTPAASTLGRSYRPFVVAMSSATLRKIDDAEVTAEERAAAARLPAQLMVYPRLGFMPSAAAAAAGPDAIAREAATYATELATGEGVGALAVGGVVSGQVIEGVRLSSSLGPCTWERWSVSAPPAIVAEAAASYLVGREDVGAVIVVRHETSGATVVLPPAAEHEPAVTDAVVVVAGRAACPADLVEGATIAVAYTYIGGEEGPTTFTWILEDGTVIGETAEPSLVIPAQAVDHAVTAVVRPVRASDLAVGAPFAAVAADGAAVIPGTPTLRNLSLTVAEGEGWVETAVVEALGEYFGGVEGDHVVAWYRGLPSDDTEITSARGAKRLTLTRADVGAYITVVVTPMSAQGVAGAPASASSPSPVQQSAPAIAELRFTSASGSKAVVEGDPVAIEYTYTGGDEGATQISWLREVFDEERQRAVFVPIVGADDATYTPSIEDIGRRLRVKVRPVRADGLVGRGVAATTVRAVTATGPAARGLTLLDDASHATPIPGTPIRASVTYVGGVEGASECEWQRRREGEGEGEEWEYIPGTRGCWEYVPTVYDGHYEIKFTYTPINVDGERGLTVEATTPAVDASQLIPAFSNAAIDRTNATYEDAAIIGETLTFVADYVSPVHRPAGAHTITWQAISAADLEASGVNDETLAEMPAGATLTIPAAAGGLLVRAAARPVDCEGESGLAVVTEFVPVLDAYTAAARAAAKAEAEAEAAAAAAAAVAAEEAAVEAARVAAEEAAAAEVRAAAEAALKADPELSAALGPHTEDPEISALIMETNVYLANVTIMTTNSTPGKPATAVTPFVDGESVLRVGATATAKLHACTVRGGKETTMPQDLLDHVEFAWTLDGAVVSTDSELPAIHFANKGEECALTVRLGGQGFEFSLGVVRDAVPAFRKIEDKSTGCPGIVAAAWRANESTTNVRASVRLIYADAASATERSSPDAATGAHANERILPASDVPECNLAKGKWVMKTCAADIGVEVVYTLTPELEEEGRIIAGEAFTQSVLVAPLEALAQEIDRMWASGESPFSMAPTEDAPTGTVVLTTKEIRFYPPNSQKLAGRMVLKSNPKTVVRRADPDAVTIVDDKNKKWNLVCRDSRDAATLVYAIEEFTSRARAGGKTKTMCRK